MGAHLVTPKNERNCDDLSHSFKLAQKALTSAAQKDFAVDESLAWNRLIIGAKYNKNALFFRLELTTGYGELNKKYEDRLLSAQPEIFVELSLNLKRSGIISEEYYQVLHTAYRTKKPEIYNEQAQKPSAWNVNKAGFYEFDPAIGASSWIIAEGGLRKSEIRVEK